ncbi:MAG: hypothetical protein COC12_12045 [Rhodobacteraceae bacterium]|nr:MAG: hypothetical protein COC12_12045 [Paracoccaceae bacterium]
MGLNQTDFAALGGVKKHAQFHYETGKRVPDVSCLGGIAEGGVDIVYLLTGTRAYLPPEGEIAENGTPSGTCSGGNSEQPPEPFYSVREPAGITAVPSNSQMTSPSPLAGAGSGRRMPPVRSGTRKRLSVVLFWAGEVIGALSLFGILYVLLFFGGIYQ